MANELKKRLLLARWQGAMGIARLMQERVDELKAEHAEAIDSLKDDHEHEIEERDEQIAELTNGNRQHIEALQDVKYWLHDGLVLHKLVSNPRDILRKVEEALQ